MNTCANCPNPLGRNPFLCDACADKAWAPVVRGGKKGGRK